MPAPGVLQEVPELLGDVLIVSDDDAVAPLCVQLYCLLCDIFHAHAHLDDAVADIEDVPAPTGAPAAAHHLRS